jgi:hypothetical protein
MLDGGKNEMQQRDLMLGNLITENIKCPRR